MNDIGKLYAGKGQSLTRRQLMKAAVSVGIGPVAASGLAANGVRANDSGQVTLPYDTEGEYDTTVPSDWYDLILDARSVNEDVQRQFSRDEGIADVGMHAGELGGENPAVFVALDKDSDKKEERRGEIPEEQHGISIEVRERRIAGRTGDCDDSFYDSNDHIPGGIRVSELNHDSLGALTSRLISGSDHNVPFGWATALHTLSDCQNPNDVYHAINPDFRWLGEVWLTDPARDFAAIKQNSDVAPRSDTVLPRYPNNTYFDHHVSGTLTRDGLEILMSRSGFEFELSGISSCRTKSTVKSSNTSKWVGLECANITYDQVEMAGDIAEAGDSGAPVITDPVEDADDRRFFSHMHSASLFDSWGPAGYYIRNAHNLWWDDL